MKPLIITSKPRYQALYNEADGATALDAWHDAYKHLAEAHVRTRVRKKTKRIFGGMKRI